MHNVNGDGLKTTKIITIWLYCVECPQDSIRLETLDYLYDCRYNVFFFELSDLYTCICTCNMRKGAAYRQKKITGVVQQLLQ